LLLLSRPSCDAGLGSISTTIGNPGCAAKLSRITDARNKAVMCFMVSETPSLNAQACPKREEKCIPPPARLACHSQGIEIAVTPYFVIIITLVAACAVGTAAFYRPARVFMRSAIAAACALGAPFIIAYAVAPLLGEGAGMGAAFILYAFSAAVVLLGALSATLGAAARHVWTTLRR
jgi:hypothetical protein